MRSLKNNLDFFHLRLGLDFVRFHTQAEGMALFISACFSEFRDANFDGSDERSVETFLSVYDDLQSYGRRAIEDDDWLRLP